ncbi:MAG: DUF2306 domain-containing protein, partial [Brevundimonas sp.]
TADHPPPVPGEIAGGGHSPPPRRGREPADGQQAEPRTGDFARHRRWMIRSLALTFAAVTLRIMIPLSMISGLDFAVAYPAIAFLCWIPNLLLVELWLRRGGWTATPSAPRRIPRNG